LKGHSPLRRLASPMLLSPSLFPTQNEPPIRASYTLPEFVQKNQEFPIWHNDFGAKNGAQAKRRVEAYLTYARVNSYPFPTKKRTSHERFVNTSRVRSEKPQLPRFGAMILDAGQGARKSCGRSVLLVREGAAYSAATQPRAKSIRQITFGISERLLRLLATRPPPNLRSPKQSTRRLPRSRRI